MQLPSIGVIIATPGRASIYRTLRSIAYQGLIPGDDVLVVGDGLHQPTKDLVAAFGPPFRYVATEITRDWGHSQLNWGLKHVKGDVIIYQDDDDIFLPRAFEEIRRLMAEQPGKPLIGRVKTPNWGLLWAEPGIKSLLDGHCMVVPNDKEKLGFMTPDYIGDQCYISTTINNYKEVNWADRVWTLTRPTWKLFPRRMVGRPTGTLSTYADNFHREMVERLPVIAERMHNGPEDWTWFFFTDARGLEHPVAALKLFEDDRRAWATLSYISGAEEYLGEIIEFAAWAGQGQNVWFGVRAKDTEIIAVLHQKGFKDHMTGTKLWDLSMEWPPSWFPYQAPPGELRDEQGVHIPDWRDKWTV